MSADRPQPRPRRQETGPPEGGASDIGRIVEHAADRGSIPMRRSFPGPTPHLPQSPAHLPQAHAIQADPCEDDYGGVQGPSLSRERHCAATRRSKRSPRSTRCLRYQGRPVAEAPGDRRPGRGVFERGGPRAAGSRDRGSRSHARHRPVDGGRMVFGRRAQAMSRGERKAMIAPGHRGVSVPSMPAASVRRSLVATTRPGKSFSEAESGAGDAPHR